MDAETSEGSPLLTRLVPLLGAVFGGLVFVVGCTAFFGFTADDAFIVVRYAQNLVEHGELAFNLGERVSALTSPLHALLTAGLVALSGAESVEVVNKLLGAVAVLGSVTAAAFLLLSSDKQRWVYWAGTLASPFVWLWTMGGLETPYLLAAVTTTVMFYLRIVRAQVAPLGWFFGIATASAAALLLRADSCLFLAPLWIAMGRTHWRKMLWPALLTAALVGAWYAFAAYYFHDLFPTSFYVKLLHRPKPLADNAGYSVQFLVLSGVAFVALVALSAWRTTKTRGLVARGTDTQTAVWVGLAIVLAYSLSHSAQHMFFAFRLFVPYLPVAFLLLAGSRGLERWRAVGCVMLLLVGQLTLARHMFTRGLNATWSMLVSDQHSEEYDDVSLLEYMAFIAALQRSAAPLYEHWQAHLATVPVPRLAVYTGGVPPVLLPQFFVLEELVSYRKQCEPNFFLQAHYAQILRIAEKDEARRRAFAEATVQRTGHLAEVVSRELFAFNGHPFVVEVLFNPEPLPVTLPRYVGDPCLTRTE